MIPTERPAPPDQNDKKQIEDENSWVYEQMLKLREKIEKASMPLSQYLETYRKYEDQYKLNPEEVIKAMDDEENPVDIDAIRKDVYFHMEEEKRLKEEIPEFVIVSMFKINTSEIRKILAEKHAKIAKEEIELIAKRARQQATDLLDMFD